MSAAPLVSVVMTAYNRERYVGAAIESVLAQTFADFELIVVDDGSVDRTVEVARQYEDDPRLRIVLNERNLGDYPNRNRAAALARGRFLKYHDSDDVMYPHCLSTMVGPLDAERRAGCLVGRRELGELGWRALPHAPHAAHVLPAGVPRHAGALHVRARFRALPR